LLELLTTCWVVNGARALLLAAWGSIPLRAAAFMLCRTSSEIMLCGISGMLGCAVLQRRDVGDVRNGCLHLLLSKRRGGRLWPSSRAKPKLSRQVETSRPISKPFHQLQKCILGVPTESITVHTARSNLAAHIRLQHRSTMVRPTISITRTDATEARWPPNYELKAVPITTNENYHEKLGR
jgi:hypothetical protein